VQILKKRRDLLINGLNALPGVSCVIPDGAFYAFPNVTGTGMDGDEFSDMMLRTVGVCVLPGSCFGKFGKNYVRLSYASTEDNKIREALIRMKKTLKEGAQK
jgi:aspartate/methionine/tyrosine aminotransferase